MWRGCTLYKALWNLAIDINSFIKTSLLLWWRPLSSGIFHIFCDYLAEGGWQWMKGLEFFFQKHLRSQAALTKQNRALVCWYLWVREAQTQHCVAYEWFTFVPLGSHLPLTPALEKVWNGNIVMSRNAWNKINRDPYSRKGQSCLVFILWVDGRLGNAKGRRKVWMS